MQNAKFDMKQIIWQPHPKRPYEFNGFVWDNIQGETVHCAALFTELGCCGYWHMWEENKSKFDGSYRDSTKLGLIGTFKLVEDKWKELNNVVIYSSN